MMVEEVKKAKELAAQPKPKSGDDEPDWQNVSRIECFCSAEIISFTTKDDFLPFRLINRLPLIQRSANISSDDLLVIYCNSFKMICEKLCG